ncbi:MAG: hypothetical protein RJQ09_05815 [Cyclobacteriaceae bacterium]
MPTQHYFVCIDHPEEGPLRDTVQEAQRDLDNHKANFPNHRCGLRTRQSVDQNEALKDHSED